MLKIDLITGFLGSGKTTFIRRYADYLMRQGESICILENDFGAINVDMMLLSDLIGDQCELEMVSGGCDADCHRRRFKTKLIAMGMSGYTRVIVEPSGLFDVDEFFDILMEEPLDRWYEIGSVIALVDAGLDEDLSAGSNYYLASEIADAGCIVFSKTQKATDEQIDRTMAHLNKALLGVRCDRIVAPDRDVITKPWDQWTDEDFERVSASGYERESFSKETMDEAKGFTSLYFMNHHLDVSTLREKSEKLLADDSYGRIFRIKGFIPENQNTWTEFNATKHELQITPSQFGQEVIIVIGEGLDRERINSLFK